MAVSEAATLLLDVVVTTFRSPTGQWLPISGKLSIGEMQIPVLEVMSWQVDVNQKVVGTNPSAVKGFFYYEIAFKVHLDCKMISLWNFCIV